MIAVTGLLVSSLAMAGAQSSRDVSRSCVLEDGRVLSGALYAETILIPRGATVTITDDVALVAEAASSSKARSSLHHAVRPGRDAGTRSS